MLACGPALLWYKWDFTAGNACIRILLNGAVCTLREIIWRLRDGVRRLTSSTRMMQISSCS